MRWVSGIALAILAACSTPGAAVEDLGPVRFEGRLAEAEDLSAAAVVGRWLYVASDEGGSIQRLERSGDAAWAVRGALQPLGSDEEIDLEGLAIEGEHLLAVGSHSLRRRRLDPGATSAENRRRLFQVTAPSTRDRVFRFPVDPETGERSGPIEERDLRELLARDPLLGPFTTIPGKENGVEIEAIAAAGERVVLGLRSPILRGGVVPLLQIDFDQPQDYALRLLDLGGRGVRDLARVASGFLLLAGFESPACGAAELYLWNGEDDLPGRDRRPGVLKRLGEVPVPNGGSPEGFTVLAEDERGWVILVLYDGVSGGAPRRFRYPRS